MAYSIVESNRPIRRAPSGVGKVGSFDSAYSAVDEIRRQLQAGNEKVWTWYLIDDAGSVLFGPDDLYVIERGEAA